MLKPNFCQIKSFNAETSDSQERVKQLRIGNVHREQLPHDQGGKFCPTRKIATSSQLFFFVKFMKLSHASAPQMKICQFPICLLE